MGAQEIRQHGEDSNITIEVMERKGPGGEAKSQLTGDMENT